MKFLQNNFIVNHRNSNWLSTLKFFHKTKIKKPAAITTATIMIFMQVIVSVHPAKTSSRVQPDTETTTASVTWKKTFNDISKNLLIAQQLRKIPTKKPWQPPYSSTEEAFKVSSILKSLHVWHTATKPVQQSRGSSAEISALSLAKGDCKSLTAAWGDIDPNIFFICDKQTKQRLQLRCPEGNGFFLGLGFSGCIPFEQWPACISNVHHEQVPLCDIEHMQQLREYKNPNKFYVCLKENIKPTILNCENGKGFVHVAVTTKTGVGSGGSDKSDGGIGASVTGEIVGCANWEKWRYYMQCSEYY